MCKEERSGREQKKTALFFYLTIETGRFMIRIKTAIIGGAPVKCIRGVTDGEYKSTEINKVIRHTYRF